jgi:hypothetical protein
MAACPLQSRGCPHFPKITVRRSPCPHRLEHALLRFRKWQKGTREVSICSTSGPSSTVGPHSVSLANIGSGRFLRSRRRRGVLRRDQVRSSKHQVRESAVSSAAHRRRRLRLHLESAGSVACGLAEVEVKACSLIASKVCYVARSRVFIEEVWCALRDSNSRPSGS